jgi:hypothetical protein
MHRPYFNKMQIPDGHRQYPFTKKMLRTKPRSRLKKKSKRKELRRKATL